RRPMGGAHELLAASAAVGIEDVQCAFGAVVGAGVQRTGPDDNLVAPVTVDVADRRSRRHGGRGLAPPEEGPVGVVGVDAAVLPSHDDVVAAVVVDVADHG